MTLGLPRFTASAAWLALCAVGCASSGGRELAVPPPSVRPPEPHAATAATSHEEPPPWDLPASALARQSLFQAELASEEGSVRLRLVLRVVDRRRFALLANDPGGRLLWSVASIDEQAQVIDHRASTYCLLAVADPLPSALALGRVDSIPALLRGRLPEAPSRPQEQGWQGLADLAYDVAPGRRLTAKLAPAGGATGVTAPSTVSGWTLWQADQPVAWLTAEENGGLLSVRRPSMQLRFALVVDEPLVDPERLAVLPAPPAGFREVTCGTAAP